TRSQRNGDRALSALRNETEFTLPDRVERGFHHAAVELRVAVVLELTQCLLERLFRLAIGTAARHGVERVCHRGNPRFERDLISLETIRNAGAVHPLMVGAHDIEGD